MLRYLSWKNLDSEIILDTLWKMNVIQGSLSLKRNWSLHTHFYWSLAHTLSAMRKPQIYYSFSITHEVHHSSKFQNFLLQVIPLVQLIPHNYALKNHFRLCLMFRERARNNLNCKFNDSEWSEFCRPIKYSSPLWLE